MKIDAKTSARKRWEDLVKQHSKTNKSAKSWCKENQVPYTSFITWRKCLEPSIFDESPNNKSTNNLFIEVSDKPENTTKIEIEVNGVVVKIANNFDPTTLKSCLNILRNLPC